MKKIAFIIIWFVLFLAVGACRPALNEDLGLEKAVEETIQARVATNFHEPVATETQPLPSATPSLVPSATQPLPSPTLEPTHTATTIPFKGFLDYFRLYRAWWLDGKTYFYFLNAGIDFKMFGKADDFPLTCEADPKNPTGMICVHEGQIEENLMDFQFFINESRETVVFEARYNAELLDDTIYHHQFDCPDRGKNVECTSEYRLYDGRCYYAHTCYDACGLYYSKDNLPKEFKEFQGYTTPCN